MCRKELKELFAYPRKGKLPDEWDIRSCYIKRKDQLAVFCLESERRRRKKKRTGTYSSFWGEIEERTLAWTELYLFLIHMNTCSLFKLTCLRVPASNTLIGNTKFTLYGILCCFFLQTSNFYQLSRAQYRLEGTFVRGGNSAVDGKLKFSSSSMAESWLAFHLDYRPTELEACLLLTSTFARVWRWGPLGSAVPQWLSPLYLMRKEIFCSTTFVLISTSEIMYSSLLIILWLPLPISLNYFMISNIVGVPAY